MAKVSKLGKRTDVRMAIIRNQVSDLFWHGKLETTLDRAKSVKSAAEKLLTKAMKVYDDTKKVKKTKVDDKGVKSKVEVVNDGVRKLNVRRELMSLLYDYKEVRQKGEKVSAFKARTAETADIKHPMMEKIFNVYAPKYAARAKELGQGGGYLRIIKKEIRKGDNAEIVVLEWV